MNQQFLDFSTQPGGEGEAGPHFSAIAASGVNTLRVFLELLDGDQTGNPSAMPAGRYWIEFPSGVYNDALRTLVLDALEEAAANGMYLIFSPFDTFTWDEAFTLETPWYSGNGGPLASIDDFFQNGPTLQKCKDRLREVMDWVALSPYQDHLLGWEPLNEWDSYEWTLNAEGGSEPGRETEMRRRAIWIRDLNQYVREQDPDHLVISSSVQLDPHGPVHRELFYDRSADVLAMHFYTNSTEEPINNPAADKSVLAGIESGQLSAYWLTHRRDNRPILNAEWGMTSLEWPGGHPAYQAGFTQAQDEALYRTVSWSGFAAGQAGQGLRIANDELAFRFSNLTDAMRDVQLTMSRVASNSMLASFARDFAPKTLIGDLSLASAGGAALLGWGSRDGNHGLAYVMQNGNLSAMTVTDRRALDRWLHAGRGALGAILDDERRGDRSDRNHDGRRHRRYGGSEPAFVQPGPVRRVRTGTRSLAGVRGGARSPGRNGEATLGRMIPERVGGTSRRSGGFRSRGAQRGSRVTPRRSLRRPAGAPESSAVATPRGSPAGSGSALRP